MRDFGRNDRGNRGGGGGRRFGGDRGPREMHKAVCDNCGRDCEVPFKPSGDKPIYCSDCFRDMGGGENRRNDSRGGRHSSGAGVDYTRQFSELNKKLDTITDILLNMKKKPRKASVKELVEEGSEKSK